MNANAKTPLNYRGIPEPFTKVLEEHCVPRQLSVSRELTELTSHLENIKDQIYKLQQRLGESVLRNKIAKQPSTDVDQDVTQQECPIATSLHMKNRDCCIILNLLAEIQDHLEV